MVLEVSHLLLGKFKFLGFLCDCMMILLKLNEPPGDYDMRRQFRMDAKRWLLPLPIPSSSRCYQSHMWCQNPGKSFFLFHSNLLAISNLFPFHVLYSSFVNCVGQSGKYSWGIDNGGQRGSCIGYTHLWSWQDFGLHARYSHSSYQISMLVFCDCLIGIISNMNACLSL